jgi:hypothetical protein
MAHWQGKADRILTSPVARLLLNLQCNSGLRHIYATVMVLL